MATQHVAAVEAVFASINPSVSDGARLSSALTDAITLVASMHHHPAGVRRVFYGGLAKVFDRIRQKGKGDSINFDLTALKTLFFGPEIGIEALRLVRADAIVAIEKSSPTLALKMKEEVGTLEILEKSSVVRDRLAQAFKEPLARGS